MLAIALAVIGTTVTVVHAAGPETTPAAYQNINSYLDQANEDLVNEMNPTFQARERSEPPESSRRPTRPPKSHGRVITSTGKAA